MKQENKDLSARLRTILKRFSLNRLHFSGNADSESAHSAPMAFRMFKYFASFIVMIMFMLWLFQILFLQTFYQQMKMNELYNTADDIESAYGQSGFYDTLIDITLKSDIYIQIDCGKETVFATGTPNPGARVYSIVNEFDTQELKRELITSDKDHVVKKTDMYANGDGGAMVYASILSRSDYIPIYMFIFSPLTAVSSTIDILAKMLINITLIALLISLVLSLVLSRRLSRPLYNMKVSAAIFGQGDYNVKFNGDGYAETEELAATLNFAAEELSKSDRLKKDLVANVTHDLKTPLTMIKSYAEMIRDLSGDNPEKRERHLEVIINEADRLNDLVNDLTALSKMQANVDSLELTDVDLASTARNSLDSFSIYKEQDGFVFDLFTDENTTVTADEKKIWQVFTNLIGNAVRYSSDDRYICIRIMDRGSMVRCEIEDRGQGISPEDQLYIWDKYYKSSRNQSRTSKGTGLGLSIVKQIFILHNARYGVDSVQGSGSCFWFELDRTPDIKKR